MSEVKKGVYFIPGRDEMIPDSHTYLIGLPSTGDLSLIDPGLCGKGKYKIQSIERLGIDPSLIKRIIFTHTHFDHLSCLQEIRKHVPQAELWIHALEAAQLENGDERTVYGMEMFRAMCQAQYRFGEGAFNVRVDRKLNGGETLDLGGTRWMVVHVPGHSIGSIALYNKSDKILISGDVVYADYAIGRFDLYGANPDELLSSLLRLGDLDVDILLPGHNRIMQKVPPTYIRDTAMEWESHLKHRQ